ncbi:hypothetical protein PACTADRAFT_49193 [Pachysolen tannophilus NRRL Y-2460]|uniref:NADH:flavin oxidoreductase/NADH oxidase N-terminal domain-containing protein n=1 Tax=Pachysolen tannophilus NRRL Y-2460 TaxID=669874 RepID=A0A1E4TVP5_PACTA|nr:hypothetical protein PACTADRAFT_49193 [Pachysolen tannophilus NRRL Y-2460]
MSGFSKDRAAPVVNYFTPKQPVPAGTALDPQPNGKKIPKLFESLKIKDLTFHNRIGVSPMCEYSSKDGFPTDYHLIHYGSLALRGPGLIIVEAAAISPEGRITPDDLGIWNDEQALALKRVVDFVHSQGQKIGIQLGHAGRKGSTVPPFFHLKEYAKPEDGGWQTVAPSPISFRDGVLPAPRELKIDEIKEIAEKWGAAAKRSIEISGFDFVEIHAAHGYLLNEFMSETSNKRTDAYGGSFDNRTRLVLDVVAEIKKNIAIAKIPLFIRVSASENLEDVDESGWKIEDTNRLADKLILAGVDVIDVSSGGNSDNQASRTRASVKEDLHVTLARQVKNHVGNRALVAYVRGLKTASVAESLLEENVADIVLVGRNFLKNPGLVWEWADQLDIRVTAAQQYVWGFYPPPL